MSRPNLKFDWNLTHWGCRVESAGAGDDVHESLDWWNYAKCRHTFDFHGPAMTSGTSSRFWATAGRRVPWRSAWCGWRSSSSRRSRRWHLLDPCPSTSRRWCPERLVPGADRRPIHLRRNQRPRPSVYRPTGGSARWRRRRNSPKSGSGRPASTSGAGSSTWHLSQYANERNLQGKRDQNQRLTCGQEHAVAQPGAQVRVLDTFGHHFRVGQNRLVDEHSISRKKCTSILLLCQLILSHSIALFHLYNFGFESNPIWRSVWPVIHENKARQWESAFISFGTLEAISSQTTGAIELV